MKVTSVGVLIMAGAPSAIGEIGDDRQQDHGAHRHQQPEPGAETQGRFHGILLDYRCILRGDDDIGAREFAGNDFVTGGL
jgi:hypothetical protein